MLYLPMDLACIPHSLASPSPMLLWLPFLLVARDPTLRQLSLLPWLVTTLPLYTVSLLEAPHPQTTEVPLIIETITPAALITGAILPLTVTTEVHLMGTEVAAILLTDLEDIHLPEDHLLHTEILLTVVLRGREVITEVVIDQLSW